MQGSGSSPHQPGGKVALERGSCRRGWEGAGSRGIRRGERSRGCLLPGEGVGATGSSPPSLLNIQRSPLSAPAPSPLPALPEL